MAEEEPFGEGLIIRKANKDDFQELLDFVCTEFVDNEPITNSINGKRADMEELFKGLIFCSVLLRIVRQSLTFKFFPPRNLIINSDKLKLKFKFFAGYFFSKKDG